MKKRSVISKRSTRDVFQVGSFLRRRDPRPPFFVQQSSDYKPFIVLCAFLSNVCSSLVSRYFCSSCSLLFVVEIAYAPWLIVGLSGPHWSKSGHYNYDQNKLWPRSFRRIFSVFPGKLPFILHGWGTHERTIFPGPQNLWSIPQIRSKERTYLGYFR